MMKLRAQIGNRISQGESERLDRQQDAHAFS